MHEKTVLNFIKGPCKIAKQLFIALITSILYNGLAGITGKKNRLCKRFYWFYDISGEPKTGLQPQAFPKANKALIISITWWMSQRAGGDAGIFRGLVTQNYCFAR